MCACVLLLGFISYPATLRSSDPYCAAYIGSTTKARGTKTSRQSENHHQISIMIPSFAAITLTAVNSAKSSNGSVKLPKDMTELFCIQHPVLSLSNKCSEIFCWWRTTWWGCIASPMLGFSILHYPILNVTIFSWGQLKIEQRWLFLHAKRHCGNVGHQQKK